jgi:hypothetical protein
MRPAYQSTQFQAALLPWALGAPLSVSPLCLKCGAVRHGIRAPVNLIWINATRRASYLDLDWLGSRESEMCDFSLHSVKSRPAKVGDKLTTHNFGTGTRGFAAQEDVNVAVCIRPGTELSFVDEVRCLPTGLFDWRGKTIAHKTAIFRQINKARLTAHHDALEFPDGRIVLLTDLVEDQRATVLQLPAEPKTASEAEAQERAAYVG